MNAPATCKEIKIPLLCLQRNAHMGARRVKMLIKTNPFHSGGMSKDVGRGGGVWRGAWERNQPFNYRVMFTEDPKETRTIGLFGNTGTQ